MDKMQQEVGRNVLDIAWRINQVGVSLVSPYILLNHKFLTKSIFRVCYARRDNMNKIMVKCPSCLKEKEIEGVLTAQSNQNVIYECPACGYKEKNIQTSKG